MSKVQKTKIIKAAESLRTLLHEYQRVVGVDEAQTLGEQLAPLAFDIEAVLSGNEID